MSIGKQIKKLREKKNVQQKTLAQAIGIRQPTLSDWESGRNEPNPRHRKKLAEYFKISESELFGGTSDLTSEIQQALEDPIAVKALLMTHKNKQEIKRTIQTLLEAFPKLSDEKRQAILALVH